MLLLLLSPPLILPILPVRYAGTFLFNVLHDVGERLPLDLTQHTTVSHYTSTPRPFSSLYSNVDLGLIVTVSCHRRCKASTR